MNNQEILVQQALLSGMYSTRLKLKKKGGMYVIAVA